MTAGAGGGEKAAVTGRPVAAAVVLALAWGLAGVALALLVPAPLVPDIDAWFFVVDVVVAVVYGGVAGLLLRRRPHPVAWLFAVAAVGGGLAAVGARYGDLPDAPLVAVIGSAIGWAWVPGTIPLVTVVPWLVRDGDLSARARAGVVAGALVTLPLFLARLTDPVGGLVPLGTPAWGELLVRTLPFQIGAVVVVGALATADVVARWAAAGPAARRGLGWLAIGSGLMTAAFVPLTLPLPLLQSLLGSGFTPITQLVAQAFFPAAALVVVLRQRLWGLDLAVSRTLVATLLSGGAVLAALLVVVPVAGALVPGRDGIAAATTAAVLALAAPPFAGWLRTRVDRLVHGPGAEPLRGARRLGRQLEDAGTDPLVGVLDGVVDALRLTSAVVELPDGRRRESTATPDGATTGPPHAVGLVAGGRSLGRLVVTAPAGERVDGRTAAVLDDLAGVVGAAVALGLLTEQLETSRARLLAVRGEERRLLRRELHDRLGPTLAGVRLGLQAAENLRAADPGRSAALLGRLAGDVDRAIEDVRGLSRQLLPPALEEHGLAAGLADLAERLSGPDLAVVVDAEPLPPLDPVVAAALYGIAAEAVTNVRRHAGATRCTVRLRVEAGAVALEVRDDGRGIGDAPPGVGLRSMRERAAELGATLAVTPHAPSGTRVAVRAPLDETSVVATAEPPVPA